MNRIIEKLKALWSNPIIKTVIMGALGATGGVLATGTLIVSKTTVTASISGAVLTLAGLYTKKPVKVVAPQDPNGITGA